MKVNVFTNGEELPVKAIEDWELKRTKHVARFLQSRLGLPKTDITRDANGPRDIASIRTELARMKMSVDANKLRSMLKGRTTFSSLSTKMIDFFSLGKRKSSVIEIEAEGCTAEEMLDRYFHLMLKNSPKNRELCLAACPDHYVLEGHGETVQEVIETTGGSPMPSKFYIYYGNDKGLTSDMDSIYPCQAAGVCCLEDGTPIGGVRHQMRNYGDGFRARLEVEFPRMLLKPMIREHQMHLACEFYNWFTWLLDEPSL